METHDKLTKLDKPTTLVNQMEGTNKEIPRQSRSRWKFQIWEKLLDVNKLTMMVELMEEADKNFLPMPKASLHAQASTNHRIEDTMGHDRLSPPINIEDLEMN